MSSIYISGVEMPKKDSVITLRIWGYGDVERLEGYHSYLLNGVKASNVLNHGRLIDADAFVNRLDDGKSRNDSEIRGARRVINQLFFAPTIIPADKEET